MYIDTYLRKCRYHAGKLLLIYYYSYYYRYYLFLYSEIISVSATGNVLYRTGVLKWGENIFFQSRQTKLLKYSTYVR